MKKLTILSDLDAIVSDLLKKLLNEYNNIYNDDLRKKDIKTYNVHEHVKPDVGEDVYKIMEKDGFYDDLEPIPGAVKALKGFAMDGHDVVVASAPSRNPNSAAEKLRWAQEHLGLNRKKIILVHEKHLLRGDVFIDDNPNKLRAYREAWPDASVLTIAYPYNRGVEPCVDLRAEGFDRTRQAWDEIADYVHKLADSVSY